MELATGGDLRRLRGAGYLEIIPALLEVAQALEHAHDRAVVHRDLKPSNVLFDARGRVRLADFGVAGTAVSGSKPQTNDVAMEEMRDTRPGLSPFTASPAQLQGEPPMPADDVYGLGALAYELLSGYPPYYPHFDKTRAIEEPVAPLVPTRQVPLLLTALVMRMLAKDPLSRPRTMRHVIDALDAALNDTLTFEFDHSSHPNSAATIEVAPVEIPAPAPAPVVSPPGGTIELPAMFLNDTNPQVAPAQEWSPTLGHDRRATPDRRATARRTPSIGPTDLAEVQRALGASVEAPSSVAAPPAVSRSTVAIDTAVPRSPSDTPWVEIPLEGLPRVSRLEVLRPRRWPWVMLGLLVGGAAAIYFWSPRFSAQDLPLDVSTLLTPNSNSAPGSSSTNAAGVVAPAVATTGGASTATSGVTAPSADTGMEERFRSAHTALDSRLAMLEARGAGAWGGRDFASAKTRAAEAVGAHDAGNLQIAQERLLAAARLLDNVETKAPQALAAQIAAGEKALGSGQSEVAGQAFQLARRIDPTSRRASDGERHARNLNGVLPLLADAENAELAREYARAAQDYSQALSLDPGNEKAMAGQQRANTAFGNDNYAKAVGSGFAALGAGRLDEAHQQFVRARALKPNGAEAAEGLRRVGAALTARGFADVRRRAAGLEAQERWDEAEQSYDAVLTSDPSLAFAQDGKARAGSRAELSGRLQELIDRPARLAAPEVRDEARALLETAQAQTPSGPVLRSQIARLQILLPGFDKPVRLSLLSDNSTQVAISSVGAFGTFSKRDIQLRPGKYVVVGTRNGFRDVRREITVAPGQETQTIRVSCSEPI
jgi:serine/threonine protein kinase/tetratricopeptide (TPR) repeat protein